MLFPLCVLCASVLDAFLRALEKPPRSRKQGTVPARPRKDDIEERSDVSDDDKRRQRRQTRLMQSESSWLQKALFALRKVEDTRDRIDDLHDRDPGTYTLDIDGRDIPLEDVEDALEARANTLLDKVRERRNRM
jgi:hypothetical protein